MTDLELHSPIVRRKDGVKWERTMPHQGHHSSRGLHSLFCERWGCIPVWYQAWYLHQHYQRTNAEGSMLKKCWWYLCLCPCKSWHPKSVLLVQLYRHSYRDILTYREIKDDFKPSVVSNAVPLLLVIRGHPRVSHKQQLKWWVLLPSSSKLLTSEQQCCSRRFALLVQFLPKSSQGPFRHFFTVPISFMWLGYHVSKTQVTI